MRNLDKVLRQIKQIPANVKAEMIKASNQNADDMVSLAQRLAPKLTGDLAASIHKEAGDTELGVRVAVDEFYGRFVEFGTAGGVVGDTVSTRDRKTFGGVIPGGRTRNVKRTHPGSKAQPFFYPAYRALKRTMKGRYTRGANKALKTPGK